MAARKIIAEVGGTRKVAGRRIATPLTDPRPGIAPINSPSATPPNINMMLRGSRAINMPSTKCPRISISLSSYLKVLCGVAFAFIMSKKRSHKAARTRARDSLLAIRSASQYQKREMSQLVLARRSQALWPNCGVLKIECNK